MPLHPLPLTHRDNHGGSDLLESSPQLNKAGREDNVWHDFVSLEGFELLAGLSKRETERFFTNVCHARSGDERSTTESVQLCLFYETFHHLICIQRRRLKVWGKFNCNCQLVCAGSTLQRHPYSNRLLFFSSADLMKCADAWFN